MTARPIHCSVLALLLAGVLLPAPQASAATGDFYAVTGARCAPSSLYLLNGSTGAATLVGDVTVEDTQVSHVTALAIHPTTGQMYAVMNDCENRSESTLLSIDKTTGTAEIIGSAGSLANQVPDMAFDPFGTLFAWSEGSADATIGDDLIRIDIENGTATKVGECHCGTGSTGLGARADGALFMSAGGSLHRMSHASGMAVDSVSLSQSLSNMLAFAPDGTLWSGERDMDTLILKTLSVGTGSVTTAATVNVAAIAALEFDLGTVTAPDTADLHLEVEVTNTTPNAGQNVTFTLTVTNGGPDTAALVAVSDVLPGGLAYVSDTGAGAYNPGTGLWTIGNLAPGLAVLQITATVTGTPSWTNQAEVSQSTTYDPDSLPGDGFVGEDDLVVTQLFPVDPLLDLAVDVVPLKGSLRPNTRKKDFVVTISNVGLSAYAVDNNTLGIDVGNGGAPATCRSFSTTLQPGQSVNVRCSANLQPLGLASGHTVVFAANLFAPLDGMTGNNADIELVSVK